MYGIMWMSCFSILKHYVICVSTIQWDRWISLNATVSIAILQILKFDKVMDREQWNINLNIMIFIQVNTFDKVVCKMFAILFKHQSVDKIELAAYICICTMAPKMISCWELGPRCFSRNEIWLCFVMKLASVVSVMTNAIIGGLFISQNPTWRARDKIDGLVQYCSNSIANAQELLQSSTKPSKWLTKCFKLWSQDDTLGVHFSAAEYHIQW